MINTTKIYLVSNIDNNPFKVYIGKTKSSRFPQHKKTYGENIHYGIIDEVKSLNSRDWAPIETYWIHQFKAWGFDIQNKTLRGGGGSNMLNPLTKNKISKSLLGRDISNWKHKIYTQDRNTKISESLKDKPKSKTHKESIKMGKKGIPNPKLQKPISQYNLNGEFIKSWGSAKEASRELGIHYGGINNNLRKISKSSGGFIWKYE